MTKVFKTLKKKAQATPLVGVILDSLKSENPRQNAPSIQAVLDNLQPKQLLINNSFQVNQRGVSEYTSIGYTLDMWRCYLVSGNKVKPITGSGIKIEKVGGTFSLRQKVPFTENDVGKKYTVSFELETDTLIESDLNFGQQKNTWNFDVGKKVYSHTFTLQSNDIVDGYVDLIIVNIGEVVANINVYYCDLWEGDIAYPHVKEDKTIALLRCQRKVRKYDTLCFVINYSYTVGRYMACCNIEKMDDIPTFVHGQVLYYNTSGSMENGTVESKRTYTSYLSITAININNMNSGSNVLFLNNVLLSCEPL